jgi:hypothetical protein
MTLLSASLLLFARLDAGSGFWDLLPGLVVGGVGMSLTMTPATAAAMGSVPVDKAGVGSAVLNSARQVGGSLGIAVMGAVIATQLKASPGNPADVEEFVRGYHHALYVAAGIAFSGAAVAIATVRQVRHAPVAEAVGV